MDFMVISSSRLEMTANLVAYSRASKEFSLLEEIFFPRARNDRIFLEDSSKDSLIVTSLVVHVAMVTMTIFDDWRNGTKAKLTGDESVPQHFVKESCQLDS